MPTSHTNGEWIIALWRLPEHKTECPHCQKYYRLKTLAERFELSEKTIRRMITEGRLKAKRIGGSIRIPHSELNKIVRDY